VRDDHAPVLSASNPAFSVLMTEGIACPVEADIKTALAMLMLKAVAGTATLAELYSMDFDDDVVILGHSGAADLTVSSRKPTLKHSAVFHGKSGSGFLTQTYPKPGPLTLLSLTQGPNGEFVMVAAEGEVVDGPAMQLGDTNARVRFAPGLRGFVNAWAKQGPTHHGVMAPGHWVGSLKMVAKLFGVDLRVVC
jgi:L-arabinose isomerase